MELKKLIIQINGESKPIKTEINTQKINYTIISNKLMELKKIRKNQIEYIRYKNKHNSWELIKKDSSDIYIPKNKIINIFVVLIKKEKYSKNVIDLINQTKNLLSLLENEITELKDPLSFKHSISFQSEDLSRRQSSLQLSSEKSNFDLNIKQYTEEEKPDIIVLTANPLVYKPSPNKIIELRDINEFSSITYSIYDVLSRTDLPIKSKFLTLTKNNLKYAINIKPKIIHLICKSTYDIDNNINNSKTKPKNEIITKDENNKNEKQKNNYSPILLFENNNCELKKITKEKLERIFRGKEEKIKEISLFISTPLSQEIYYLIKNIKPKIKFKNVIIQHTTLADILYMEEFNRDLYYNLLDKQTIEYSFNKAKSNSLSSFQFCCCYHRHKNECILKQNLSNEIFRNNEENDLIEIYEEKKTNKDLIYTLPHIHHLRYKCECNNNLTNSFIRHESSCNNYKKGISLCCCKNNNDLHNLNDIFQIYFNDNEKIIFDDYNYDEYKKSEIMNKENIPHFDKMKFKVGFNIIFYNIFELIQNKNYNIINFFGYQIKIFDIDDIINILIEYIKERNSYFSDDNTNIKSFYSNKEIIQDLNINKNDLSFSSENSSNYNLDIKIQMSEKQKPNKFNIFKSVPNIIILNQEKINNLNKILNVFNNNNIIYIINTLTFTDWDFEQFIKKIKTKIDLTKANIIIFGKNKIEYKEDNIKIENIHFNNLDIYDNMIKYQMYKIKKENEKDFKELLIENVIDLEDKEIDEIKNYINNHKNCDMCYSLLYLFQNVYRGLFIFEFKELFNEKEIEEANKILNEFLEKKIIKAITESVQKTKKEIKRRTNEYTKYIKNKIILNKILTKIKIEDDIKYDILQRLFLFYAKKFRLLIKKIREERNQEELKINHGYNYNESLFSFSSIQPLGIWLPLKNAEKLEDNSEAPIFSKLGYFNHLYGNLGNIIFFEDNIKFCHENMNKDNWENIKDSLEDISITLLTLCKIYGNKGLNDYIQIFKNYFKTKKYNFSKSAELRLKLFDIMQMYNDNTNNKISVETLKIIENIEKNFSQINNKEGQLETLFALSIINKENILSNIINIYEKKMKILLRGLNKEKNKENFVSIFEIKINYKIIKYKIKSKKNEDFIEETIKIIKRFKEIKNKFYIIKTFLLISYYYRDKIKNGINIEKLKNDFFLYLNAASIYTIYTRNEKYNDYLKDKVKKKFKLEDKNFTIKNKYYGEFKKNLMKLLEEYGLGNCLSEKNNYNFYYKEKIEDIINEK